MFLWMSTKISPEQRFNLVEKLSQLTDAKIVAVGDDWQSILRLRGGD